MNWFLKSWYGSRALRLFMVVYFFFAGLLLTMAFS
jgi:hypothetical protein